MTIAEVHARKVRSGGGFARRSGPRLPTLLLAMAALSASSCESCGGSGGGGGGTLSSGGGSWLVGQAGAMVNVAHDHLDDIGHYDLDVSDDLLGIACRGTREAWIVGSAGLALATRDAGATWRVLDPGVPSTLRTVALAGADMVYVAGDSGVFRVSLDGGNSWRALPAPARTFTSLAARRVDGMAALLATAEGELYRYDATRDQIARVGVDAAGPDAAGGGALYTVVLSRDGQTAIAAGEGGRLLVSRDGGLGFWSQAPVSPTAIRDVWLIGDRGDRFVAVGDDGLLLTGSTGGAPTVARLGQGASLRAIHMSANGHGAIVGDQGTLFFTDDGGRTWRPINTGETRNLYGLDALDLGPHL